MPSCHERCAARREGQAHGEGDWDDKAWRPISMSDIPERLIRIRKRIAMTEQRIAAQRARVHRWQAKGNRLLADRASVLLTVMETTAERLRALRATLEACELQLKLGARWSAAVGVEAPSSSPTTV